MASDSVVIGGVRMPHGAACNVEWAGMTPADVADDVKAAKEGKRFDELLADCQDGAEDEETLSDWEDYVAAVYVASGLEAEAWGREDA